LAAEYGTVIPPLQMVFKGTRKVTIYCHSSSPVIWYNPYEKIIKSSVNINGNQLILYDLKNRDTGNYTCVGTEPNNIFLAKSELLVGG